MQTAKHVRFVVVLALLNYTEAVTTCPIMCTDLKRKHSFRLFLSTVRSDQCLSQFGFLHHILRYHALLLQFVFFRGRWTCKDTVHDTISTICSTGYQKRRGTKIKAWKTNWKPELSLRGFHSPIGHFGITGVLRSQQLGSFPGKLLQTYC